MNEHNPYRAPESEVSVDIGGGEHYQPKIFSVEGRIGRMRYWVYSILVSFMMQFVLGFGSALILGLTGSGLDSAAGFDGFGVVGVILSVVTVVAAIAVSLVFVKRRLNDVNQSGWIGLIMLVPIANLVLGLYLLFARGTVGSNKYGPEPVPNSTGVKVAFVLSLLLIVAVVTAIAVPAYSGYLEAASLQGFEVPAE